MRNRVKGAWRALRGRRVFALASVGGIAALLLGTLGASTAVAHGMVDSGRITNQTIRSWDISAGGVGQSEIRADGVDQSEIEDQSIQSWNIGADEVTTSEIRDGTVREEDLGFDPERGPQGPPGEDGEDGVSGYEVDGFYTVERANRPDAGAPIPPNATAASRTVSCADGKYAIGGGGSGEHADDTEALTVKSSHPSGPFEPIQGDPEGSVRATSWTVMFANSADTEKIGRVWIVCVNIAEAQ